MSRAGAGAMFGHAEGQQRPLLGSWWRRALGRGAKQGAAGNRGSWWRPRAGNAEGGRAVLPFYRARRLGWWTGQHAGRVGLG
jgi:hypothetical protein